MVDGGWLVDGSGVGRRVWDDGIGEARTSCGLAGIPWQHRRDNLVRCPQNWELSRRLVASDDRLFVTLGYGEPATALDKLSFPLK